MIQQVSPVAQANYHLIEAGCADRTRDRMECREGHPRGAQRAKTGPRGTKTRHPRPLRAQKTLASDLLLSTSRFLTKQEVSDDLRATFRQGGRVLPRPLEPRQGRPVDTRGQLHRLVPVERVRQGRHHHLGIVALGLLHTPLQLRLIMLSVAVLTLLGRLSNRLGGFIATRRQRGSRYPHSTVGSGR